MNFIIEILKFNETIHLMFIFSNQCFCKIDIIDFADETLANVSEMKDVKCNNIYLNMLKLKIDFRKIRKHFVT